MLPEHSPSHFHDPGKEQLVLAFSLDSHILGSGVSHHTERHCWDVLRISCPHCPRVLVQMQILILRLNIMLFTPHQIIFTKFYSFIATDECVPMVCCMVSMFVRNVEPGLFDSTVLFDCQVSDPIERTSEIP